MSRHTYPQEILRKAEELCQQIHDGDILSDVEQLPPFPQKKLAQAFGVLIRQSFPSLSDEQTNELYSYGMMATR